MDTGKSLVPAVQEQLLNASGFRNPDLPVSTNWSLYSDVLPEVERICSTQVWREYAESPPSVALFIMVAFCLSKVPYPETPEEFQSAERYDPYRVDPREWDELSSIITWVMNGASVSRRAAFNTVSSLFMPSKRLGPLYTPFKHRLSACMNILNLSTVSSHVVQRHVGGMVEQFSGLFAVACREGLARVHES